MQKECAEVIKLCIEGYRNAVAPYLIQDYRGHLQALENIACVSKRLEGDGTIGFGYADFTGRLLSGFIVLNDIYNKKHRENHKDEIPLHMGEIEHLILIVEIGINSILNESGT
jgi:hypothetical protein